MTNSIHHSRQMRPTSVALLLLLVGFAFRLHNLDTQPLSADEAFTVVVWNQGTLHQLLTHTALIDPQPPATLLGIVDWLHLVGTSEFAARYLSVLAAGLTLAAIYQLTKTLAGPRPALIALLLGLINPFLFWYAQDIRAYSLWLAVSSLSMLAMVKAFQRPHYIWRWVIYSVITTLSLYIFYLECLFIVAQNFFALVQTLRTKTTKTLVTHWMPSQLVVAFLIAPWYLRPALRTSGYHPTAIPSSNIPWIFETLSFGATLPSSLTRPLLTIGSQSLTIPALFAILLFAVALFNLFHRTQLTAAWFAALHSLIPILLLTTLTIITQLGFFRPRYLAPATIPIIIAIALLLHNLLTSNRLHAAVSVAIALLLATMSITSIITYRLFDPKSPPWRAIASFLDTQPGPNDLIIRNFPDPSFDYYYHGENDTILLPVEPTTPTSTTYATLTSLTHQYNALWFMPVPYVSHDPDQIVAHWLYDNTQLISEHWIDSTHILQFSAWEVNERDIEHLLDTTFEQTAVLRGYNLTPTKDRWKPGENVTVELFWEPLQKTRPLLTIFFHVLAVDNDGNITLLTQDDGWPQEGRVTTQTWEPGQLYRDVHTITLPPSADGPLTFTAGFYNAETSERIPPVPAPNLPLMGPNSPVLLTVTYP